MTTRRGLGAGRGKGYRNMIPHDRPVHQMSAKGMKQPQRLKNLSFAQLKKRGVFLRYQGDADHDGVPNIKDCRPLNPKKHLLGLVAVGAAGYVIGRDKKRRAARSGKDSELTVRKLRLAYEKAVADGRPEFTVEGKTFVTNYAKYMLEYLKMRKLKDRDSFTLTEESGKAPLMVGDKVKTVGMIIPYKGKIERFDGLYAVVKQGNYLYRLPRTYLTKDR